VAIKTSSSREVETLLAQLRNGRSADRDAAVARLRVIGARAIDRLSATIGATGESAATRAAALRALEDLEDPRARDAALRAARDDDEDVAAAAIAVLRGWIADDAGAHVLDTLTAIALDQERPARARLAALDAISQLPRDLVQPVLQQMGIEGRGLGLAPAPDDPIAARDWLSRQDRAPLSTLHDFIVEVRNRERQEPSARRRQDWLVTRGAAHALLARRGSRVALYDLRETFDAAQAPLPLDFLTAITSLGDVDCLEPMARAWASVGTDAWWKDRVADAATDIMHRLRLSGRSGIVKRIRAKYDGFL